MTCVDHIDFGCPLNYSAALAPTPTFTNHREDPAYAHHVVETELRKGVLLGPLDVPPFTLWAQCSPILTRPKSTPRKRLSLPPGTSVNSGIPRREYLSICGRLGHCLAPDMCVAPIPRLVWLGFKVCAERMTLHIPDEKLCTVLEE